MQVFLDIRRSEVTDCKVSLASHRGMEQEETDAFLKVLQGHQLHTFEDWREVAEQAKLDAASEEVKALCTWLDSVLPTRVQTGETG